MLENVFIKINFNIIDIVKILFSFEMFSYIVRVPLKKHYTTYILYG